MDFLTHRSTILYTSGRKYFVWLLSHLFLSSMNKKRYANALGDPGDNPGKPHGEHPDWEITIVIRFNDSR